MDSQGSQGDVQMSATDDTPSSGCPKLGTSSSKLVDDAPLTDDKTRESLRALARVWVELTAIRAAVAPVEDWYVNGDHPLRLDEIVTGIVKTNLRYEAQLRQVDDVLVVLHLTAKDGDYRTALRHLVEAELAIAGHFEAQDAEKIAALEAENTRLHEAVGNHSAETAQKDAEIARMRQSTTRLLAGIDKSRIAELEAENARLREGYRRIARFVDMRQLLTDAQCLSALSAACARTESMMARPNSDESTARVIVDRITPSMIEREPGTVVAWIGEALTEKRERCAQVAEGIDIDSSSVWMTRRQFAEHIAATIRRGGLA